MPSLRLYSLIVIFCALTAVIRLAPAGENPRAIPAQK